MPHFIVERVSERCTVLPSVFMQLLAVSCTLVMSFRIPEVLPEGLSADISRRLLELQIVSLPQSPLLDPSLGIITSLLTHLTIPVSNLRSPSARLRAPPCLRLSSTERYLNPLVQPLTPSWWSHIRSHPLAPSVADSKAFVDACERAGKKGDEKELEKLQKRQWDELRRLVDWTRENCK